MSTLFDLTPTTQALLLAALALGVLLLLLGLGVSNPLLWRMGLRTLLRRRGLSLIMLCGLLLSAIFITASYGLQDSLNHSLESDRLTKIGNVDASVTGSFTQSQVDDALAQIRQQPEVQAATAISLNPLVAQVQSNGSRASNFYVLGVPPDFTQVYGALNDEQGRNVSLPDLRPGEVLLSHSSATALAVHAGDQIQISASGATIHATVRAMLANDPVVTSGELAFDGQYSEVIMPLATLQQALHQPLIPNTICIKLLGPGGMDDIGPNGSRSQVLITFLDQLFHTQPDTHGTVPAYFDHTIIHALKPDFIVEHNWSPVAGKGEFLNSPAARQFTILLPAFTDLLVGAGMLLLVLLCLLLAADRRAELGLSRAIGLQRGHLVRTLLLECSGYALLAAGLGLPFGFGLTALELFAFGHLPTLDVYSTTAIPLHPWLNWESLLSAASIVFLTTVVIALLVGSWISYANIVAAIRNLDDPPRRTSLLTLLNGFRSRPLDASGQPVESPQRILVRRVTMIGRLLWELFVLGPLCLLAGLLLFELGSSQQADWIAHLGVVLLLAGGGFLLSWLSSLLRFPVEFGRWLGGSLIGLGWLIYGLQIGTTVILLNFAGDIRTIFSSGLQIPPMQDILLSLLLPLVGLVVLLMNNADGIAVLLTLVMRRVRGLVPVSRTSTVYPLTFRFRSGVAVALLSLVVFLVMLVITSNLGIGQQSLAAGQKGAVDVSSVNGYTTGVTHFLVAYLIIGLLFGALSLGVIVSRAVVERQQEIGMLRAIGFTATLVRRSFLLEAAFIVTLSLVIGTTLAWWLVLQAAHANTQDFLLPVVPAILLVLGSYLIVFVCTWLPARRASHLPPAEALRYE